MTDEELEALEEKVRKEKDRRKQIESLKNSVEKWNKHLGIKTPDGWTSDFNTIIHQTYMVCTSPDGNGPCEQVTNRIEMTKNDLKLFALACDLIYNRIKGILKDVEEEKITSNEMYERIHNLVKWEEK